MKKVIIIMTAVIGIFIILLITMQLKMNNELKHLEYDKVDLNEIADGIYQGKAETTFVKAAVAVEVSKHKIIRIDILSHDNGMGKKAERITEDMIKMNTYDVDVVSGATSSSQVIKSAVSHALAAD